MLTAQSIAPLAAADSSLTRVILVRHGRSTFNEQGRYQGSSDESVLTETGWKTTRLVGRLLKNHSIDAIYASPLKRVEETISAIRSMGSDDRLIPVHKTQQLREIDLLAWEGLSFKVVQEQFPEAYRCWKEHPHQFQLPIDAAVNLTDSNLTNSSIAAPPFFPVLDLYDRAQIFWETTLSKHRGQTLLIVGHGGTNHALISTAIGLSPAQHHMLQQSNCGVSVLEFPPDEMKGKLRSLNVTTHLGETLPKLKEGKQGLRLIFVPATATTEQIQQLADRLRSVPIHFSLSTRFDRAQTIVDSLLSHHPTAVQLHVAQANFPTIWQQVLADRLAHSIALLTGIVLAHPQTIQILLAEAIALSDLRRLPIDLGAFSVMHYPSPNQQPVLQTLNSDGVMCDRTDSLITQFQGLHQMQRC